MFDPQASEFWRATIRSGLMDAKALTACWDAIEPTKRDVPEHVNRRLARQAVQAKLLTFWQAQQLLAGKSSGFRIDRYLLLDLIGQGGMGRVYLARDTRLDRLVAVKILAAERLSNPRSIARFQREARLGAQLQHEYLVRIYDYGESSGKYFLVMEYIEGKTIAALISEQGPMPPAIAVRLARQIALGLEHAHRKGLIHRDVNPYNILVTRDGTAKLADLGLAIALAEEERVTRDGATVGTFDYVAPEQARSSRAADARSDIYSLGCTIYHMCNGQVPFPGPSLPEKLLAHQTVEATPLWRMVPGIPVGLSEIVERMMKKLPDERYATPLEVATALARYDNDDSSIRSDQDEPAILQPLVLEPIPQSSQTAILNGADPAAALVKTVASPAGREYPHGLAANRDSGPYAADSAAPLLTPDDEFDDPSDEIRLILDPDPELSASALESRPEPRSSPHYWALLDYAVALVRGLAPIWLWGLVFLAVIMMVLVAMLATG